MVITFLRKNDSPVCTLLLALLFYLSQFDPSARPWPKRDIEILHNTSSVTHVFERKAYLTDDGWELLSMKVLLSCIPIPS